MKRAYELLKELKLHGMLEELEAYQLSKVQKSVSHQAWLLGLLKAEQNFRKKRSIDYQLNAAKFPVPRYLNQFRFEHSVVNEQEIRALHDGGFIQEHKNIVLVGGPGTGKSHIATGIATHVIENAMRARFFNVPFGDIKSLRLKARDFISPKGTLKYQTLLTFPCLQ